MQSLFPYPPQAIHLSQGSIVSLRTRDNECRKKFVAVDVKGLTDSEVFTHFCQDIIAATPTPGFDIVFEGRVMGQPFRYEGMLKVKSIFGPPRSSVRLVDTLGVEGEIFNGDNWMTMMAHLRLGDRPDDRWDFINCYFTELASKGA